MTGATIRVANGAKSGHERQVVVGLRQHDGREHARRGDDYADANPDVLWTSAARAVRPSGRSAVSEA
jgi:hypothetical protein